MEGRWPIQQKAEDKRKVVLADGKPVLRDLAFAFALHRVPPRIFTYNGIFSAATGSSLSTSGVGTNIRSAVFPIDFDADGDIDLVSATDDFAGLRFAENVGNISSFSFIERTGSAENPFHGLCEKFFATVVVEDFDDDGYLDVLCGFDKDANGKASGLESCPTHPTTSQLPIIHYRGMKEGGFEQTQPEWLLALKGAEDMLYLTLGDIDGDGDRDLVAGTCRGTILFFERSGTGFVKKEGVDNPFFEIDVGAGVALAAPSLTDIDGDGDDDLVVGSRQLRYRYGMLSYFENVGNRKNAAFTLRKGQQSPFHAINMAQANRHDPTTFSLDRVVAIAPISHAFMPAFADLDADGDDDLIAGQMMAGKPRYYENIGGLHETTIIDVTHRNGKLNPFDNYFLGLEDIPNFSESVPAIGDFNLDGLDDLLIGFKGARLVLYLNRDESPPSYVLADPQPSWITTMENHYGEVGILIPHVVALTGGNFDLVMGLRPVEYGGRRELDLWRNVGINDFELAAFPNPFASVVAESATIAFGDYDDDDDMDFIVPPSSPSQWPQMYENVGTQAAPDFAKVSNFHNPFPSFAVGITDGRGSAYDMDGDGDLDFVVGGQDGSLSYFENIGDREIADFMRRHAYNIPGTPDNPFSDVAGGVKCVATSPFNGDAIEQCQAFGTETECINNYDWMNDIAPACDAANPGQTNDAQARECKWIVTGSLGVTVSRLHPVLADINKDGFFDVVVGTQSGHLHYLVSNACSPENDFLCSNNGVCRPQYEDESLTQKVYRCECFANSSATGSHCNECGAGTLEKKHSGGALLYSATTVTCSTSYEKKYYWWETVEMCKKFLLTGGLVLVEPGTSPQILFAILITLAYLIGLLQCKPFEEADEDILSSVTTIQLLLALLCGLVLMTQSEETGLYETGLMDFLLVFMSLCVAILSATTVIIEFGICNIVRKKKVAPVSYTGNVDDNSKDAQGQIESTFERERS
eukprot:g325.t1